MISLSPDSSGRTASPSSAILASGNGTEYQQVIPELAIHSASSSGNMARCAGTSDTRAPAEAAAFRSSTDMSKWNGEWLLTTSADRTSNSRTAQCTKLRQPRWLNATPLGSPVDPEV